MQLASSLYRGGLLVAAVDADYSTSRDLGLICPFCKESVYLVKGHARRGSAIPAAWRHYRVSAQSAYCEQRVLTRDGKNELKALQKTAHNQRLKLFNRRFWEIFSYKKAIPPNLRRTCLRIIDDEATLDRMIVHCWEHWDVEAILKALPTKIIQRMGNPKVEEVLRNHPAFAGVIPEVVDEAVKDFADVKFSVLRHKILSEVIEWLGTKTALPSFGKLIELSLLDCLEVLTPPIHSQQVAEMAIVSLTLTDWEASIEALKDKNRAIGFA